MEIYDTRAEIASRKNWFLSLVVITLVTFGTLVVLQGVAMALIPTLFQVSLEELIALVNGEYDIPNGRMALLFTQGIGSGLGFWVATWICIRFLEKAELHWASQRSRVNLKNLTLVTVITLGGMLFNGLLVYWNSHLILPASLAELETWMREMETQLMELTQYLTDFQSIPELLTGILVIGVFAGVGEELFFRGLLQPKLQGYLRSPHWGIWLCIYLFSNPCTVFRILAPFIFRGFVWVPVPLYRKLVLPYLRPYFEQRAYCFARICGQSRHLGSRCTSYGYSILPRRWYWTFGSYPWIPLF